MAASVPAISPGPRQIVLPHGQPPGCCTTRTLWPPGSPRQWLRRRRQASWHYSAGTRGGPGCRSTRPSSSVGGAHGRRPSGCCQPVRANPRGGTGRWCARSRRSSGSRAGGGGERGRPAVEGTGASGYGHGRERQDRREAGCWLPGRCGAPNNQATSCRSTRCPILLPMAIRLGSVVINCADLELMTAFWAAALDLKPRPVGDDCHFRVLGGPRVNVSLQVAQTPVSARDQMHLDLYTDNQPGEVRRLLDLGASYVRHNEDPDDDYVVLADPEGNQFCVCAVAKLD